MNTVSFGWIYFLEVSNLKNVATKKIYASRFRYWADQLELDRKGRLLGKLGYLLYKISSLVNEFTILFLFMFLRFKTMTVGFLLFVAVQSTEFAEIKWN